jgi:hypothetical protein
LYIFYKYFLINPYIEKIEDLPMPFFSFDSIPKWYDISVNSFTKYPEISMTILFQRESVASKSKEIVPSIENWGRVSCV